MKTKTSSAKRRKGGDRPRSHRTKGPHHHEAAGRAASRERVPRGQVWKGSISFGLVNIPVSLQSGENRKELGFTMLDRRNLSPIGYRKYNKSNGAEVPAREVVKGFKVGDDRYVVVSDADFRRASPERTQHIEIAAFIDEGGIPPAFYDRPYYLEPAPKSEKAYALLRDAMTKLGKIAIATVVLRSKQHLAAVIPQGRLLTLELLRYPAELRDPADVHAPAADPSRLKIAAGEAEMAKKLVEQMTKPWRPEDYKDVYEAELLAFIHKKAKSGGAELGASPETPKDEEGAPDADIMELLKKSLNGK